MKFWRKLKKELCNNNGLGIVEIIIAELVLIVMLIILKSLFVK